MTGAEVRLLSPLLVLAATPVLIMLLIAVKRRHSACALLATAGLVGTLAALTVVMPSSPERVTSLLVIDGFAVFFMFLIVTATLAVVWLSYRYLEDRPGNPEEYYVLLLLACLGAVVVVCSSHFASFFLGLEILGICLYALIAYDRRSAGCIEAGVKYLILTALSDSLLLFGMALIYACSGTLQFGSLAGAGGAEAGIKTLAGWALLITGIGFKLSLVPFHMWTPDVYEGAPAPVTAFVATVSKGAVFAVLLRYFAEAVFHTHAVLMGVFTIIAAASMITGNLLALLQDNVKRVLAYSSIAHLGYLLVAFIASGPTALSAAGMYLTAYFVSILAAFGVITVLSHGKKDCDSLADYRGLGRQRPFLAGVFTAALLSLAGVPLTAGFIGKLFLFIVGVETHLWPLLAIFAMTSVVGLYYYLRIIVILFATTEPQEQLGGIPSTPAALVIAGLTILLIGLGVYPGPFLHFMEMTVARLQ